MENVIRIKLKGLDCPHCAEKITADIQKLENLQNPQINLIKQELSVEKKANCFTEVLLTQITEIVHKYEPDVEVFMEQNQKTFQVTLKGLDCANCAAEIEQGTKTLPKVKNATVNLLKQQMEVTTEQYTSIEELLQSISEIVHKHEPDVKVFIASQTQISDTKQSEKSEFQKEFQKTIIRFCVGIVFFVGGVLLIKQNISFVPFLISYIIFGYDVLWRAIKNIKKGQIFDENFLMSISTIGAIFLGEMAEAVFVMLFYQIGETFQSYAVDRSRKSITELMDIRPDYANLVVGEQIKKVEPSEVAVGNYIVVKAGEKIPLDGIVVEGNGQLDTSALTGEALPVNVSVGEEVYSGSLNINGLFKIQVTKNFGNSTVVKILEMVENATAKKSKTEQFITKFARVYTPFVVCAAALLAIIPPLFIGGTFQMWLSRALIFLVISCPCALVLSVPLGFFSGIGEASKRGILVKGSNYIHALKDVDTIVFDKTGTLTKGVFEVAQINTINNYTEKMILEIAAKAEKNSNHPIAVSITKQYETKYGKIIEEIQNYKEIGGYGVCCQINGKQVLAGNEKLMKQFSIEYIAYTGIGSIVYIAEDGKFIGSIVVADTIKQSSKKAIQKLKALGIQNTIMLTGDNAITAKQISKELELNEYYAELLPQNKVEILEKILKRQDKNKVIFVGDGINDAPVLARADIGIAMGGIGSDAAIEAADVVIMNDDIGKIEDGIIISKNTSRIVNQNIVFALAVKMIVLVLGALGIATMWLAVFADVGVALIAILNSMKKKI
ncbi:heavy metal translocating P-type ATPase [Clostridium sp. MD294]|uniref:heavy metal translocating P-type ATPase n=1 Tax=Clostridium sp. MD294 TaxID=97138 RepID=UPI0002CC97B4|nr:heavy metal translocating P-type ATPase [Clostridium sp. MD294]NDO47520.1 cadmium-translocating P-type ATPase [Clostridium sp. MD294]USF29408.1 Cadmium, zinc and cobalt-transporting ATPase [Clostridium sp. MD294]